MWKLTRLITQCSIGLSLLILPQVETAATKENIVRDNQTQIERLSPPRKHLPSKKRLNTYLDDLEPPKFNLAGGNLASSFDVLWYVISGGGSASAAGAFELTATIGQAGAGTTGAGDFSITGGFGAGFQDLLIFGDGFESGNLSAWTSSLSK